jgi:predicted dienelactone hydrolase
MRPIEVPLVIVSALVVVGMLFLRGRRPAWLKLLAIAAAVLFLAHAFFEGIHWQLFPEYLALVLFLFALFKPTERRVMALGWICAALLLVSGAFCYTIPMFHLPKPVGPYPIGTRTVHLIDPSRQETHPHSRPGNREVVLQFWYPSATATGRHAMYREFKETKLRSTYQAVLPVDALQDSAIANRTFPVIFFNPAWNGFRNRSTFITQNLASLGFIVVGISHPYNSAFTELSDGYVAQSKDEPDLGEYSKAEPLSERLNLAKSELAVQLADDEFVLEQLTKLNETPDSPFYHHLEMDNVGAFGHSFGGSVSVELALKDPRVKCALEMDGSLYGQAEATGLPKPLMTIHHPEGALPPNAANSPDESIRVWADMRQRVAAAFAQTFSRYGGYAVNIDGIDHESYTDKGFFSPIRRITGIGSMRQTEAAPIINGYVAAFFLQYLAHKPQPLLSGAIPPLPHATLTIWPGPAIQSGNQSGNPTAANATQPTP